MLDLTATGIGFVNLFNRIRPSFSRFTFVFIGLAISVFTWGLQYKLSLYYPPHSTYHQIPEAKLLSRNEQAPATDGILTGSAQTPADLVSGGLFALTYFVCALQLLSIFRAHPNKTRAHAALAALVRRQSDRVFLPASSGLPPGTKLLDFSGIRGRVYAIGYWPGAFSQPRSSPSFAIKLRLQKRRNRCDPNMRSKLSILRAVSLYLLPLRRWPARAEILMQEQRRSPRLPWQPFSVDRFSTRWR